AVLFGGQAQYMVMRGKVVIVIHGLRAVGINKQDPETVIYYIECQLASTDRAFDKPLDNELCLIQHEAIARISRQGTKSGKRICGNIGRITGQFIYRERGLKEQRFPARSEERRVGKEGSSRWTQYH